MLWQDWWAPLLGVTLAAATLSVVVAYMAAAFLGDEKLRAWSKHEAFQIFYSLLIVIFALALIPAFNFLLERIGSLGTPQYQSYFSIVCGGGPWQTSHANVSFYGRPCHVALAIDYLDILFKTSKAASQSLLYAYGWFSFFATLNVDLTATINPAANTGISPLAGLSGIANPISLLFDLLIKNMVVIRFQQFFIDFFAISFFPFFLGAGLILRMLHFTRKLGGLLIALALGFYIVFPLFYALSGAILFTMTGGWTGTTVTLMNNSFATGGADYPTPNSAGINPDNPLPEFRENPSNPNPNSYTDPTGQTARRNLAANICAPAPDPNNPATQQAAGNFFGMMGEVGMKGSQILNRDWVGLFVRMQGLAAGEDPLFGRDGLIDNVAKILVFSMVIPFLALMTTLAGVKAFSPLLGGDVEIAGLTRLI